MVLAGPTEAASEISSAEASTHPALAHSFAFFRRKEIILILVKLIEHLFRPGKFLTRNLAVAIGIHAGEALHQRRIEFGARYGTVVIGIGGAQHDHGIHQFMFGPDGRLYFNFGNNGKQLKDKNGKPVIDLADQIAVDSYEIPDRISQRVKLKRPTCVFPHCTRTSTRTDLDHIDEYVPPDQGGPPGQTSTATLAPLCRRHHRAKTHPSPVSTSSTTVRWDYDQLTPTTWLWTSPHGLRFLVHPDGTTEL